MVNKLNKIEDKVLILLENAPQTRESDKMLYLAFLKKYGYNTDVSLFNYLIDNSYPSFDSISRARRKIQANRPDLVENTSKNLRHKNEMVYFNYGLQAKNDR